MDKLKIGILSTAHGHVWSYYSNLKARSDSELIGIWDDPAERGEEFAQRTGLPFVGYLEDLLGNVDAVVIASENNRHAELAVAAARAGKHIICEKPLAARTEDIKLFQDVVGSSGVKLMTAFPCRFSPAYKRLRSRVKEGTIGNVRAICATNRGRCPFDWFVQKELSGGGAMIDHVVHVTDLLRDLTGEEPARVMAQTGNNVYGQDWEDTAMVTMDFPSGIFATLDSSWSRPQSFKTWGDVTMTVVGDSGVIEMDMFGSGLDHYSSGNPSHSLIGYGTDLDGEMIGSFVRACIEDKPVPVTMFDGLQAARVAMAGYQSVESGQPVVL